MAFTTETFENLSVKQKQEQNKTHINLLASMGVGVFTQRCTFTKGAVCSGVTDPRERLNELLFLGVLVK